MSSIWYLKSLSYMLCEHRNLIQSVRRALAEVDGDIHRELAKVVGKDGAFMVVVRYV